MSSLKHRFSVLLTHEDLNPNQFYIKTGLSNGFLDKVGSRVNKATAEKIEKAFPNLSMDWLLQGKGEMLKHEHLGTSQSIVGDGNIANTGIIQGDINTSKPKELLDLYIPSHLGRTNLFELNSEEVTETLITSLRVLKEKADELEKEVIRLNGEVSKRDETIKGLKNELAIRIEMITFLQNKK